tara:strand:+ start:74387 stop:74617 length:231 start_codon:yes stop_codon:yes gene_type:complete
MISKFLIKDTAGNKSLTATAFALGFILVNLKLLFSGSSFGSVIIAPFSGVEYAAAIAALGGVYVLRRQKSPDEKSE